MNCEKCGEVCDCPIEPSVAPDLMLAAGMLQEERTGCEAVEDGDPVAWRGEVAARLNRYRARRKAPPPRYPSLKLPFGTAELSSLGSPVESSSYVDFERSSNHALALSGICPESFAQTQVEMRQEEQPLAASAPRVIAQGGAKIIEFPRFAWGPPPPPPDQLAEPVSDRPRILEVPEVAPQAPALGGITIEPLHRELAEKRPGIDLPLQSAPVGRRVLACFVDTLIIAVAAALFGFIFWKVAGIRPPQMQLLTLSAGVFSGFWAAYQFLLIVYSGSTPGLRAAGLELSRFSGESTCRSLRRWRVLASYLSALSLGMGYIWVFLDEDALCWHDRITHTYLAPSQGASRSDPK